MIEFSPFRKRNLSITTGVFILQNSKVKIECTRHSSFIHRISLKTFIIIQDIKFLFHSRIGFKLQDTSLSMLIQGNSRVFKACIIIHSSFEGPLPFNFIHFHSSFKKKSYMDFNSKALNNFIIQVYKNTNPIHFFLPSFKLQITKITKVYIIIKKSNPKS